MFFANQWTQLNSIWGMIHLLQPFIDLVQKKENIVSTLDCALEITSQRS